MSEEMKTYGQIAYEAYCEISGSLSLATGDQLPGWDDLPDDITNAWMAAGRAVDEQVRTDGIAAPPPADRDALEQAAAPEVDMHRWYAVIRHGGEVVTVIGHSDDGLRQFATVDEWDASQ